MSGERPVARCGAPKTDGSPCASRLGLSPVNGRCLMHDPDRAEQRDAVRSAGGKAGSEAAKAARAERAGQGASIANLPKPPKTLSDAANYLSWLIDATARGLVDARTSHELAVGVREFRLALEKRDLEGQIVALRKKVKELSRLKGVLPIRGDGAA